MATRSIYKDVTIKNRVLGRGLASALECAKYKKRKDVVVLKKVSTVSKDKIKEIFDN